jgi:hypothetical protein
MMGNGLKDEFYFCRLSESITPDVGDLKGAADFCLNGDFFGILDHSVNSEFSTVLPRIQLSEYYSNSSAKSH